MSSHKAVKAERARYYQQRLGEVIEAKKPLCMICGKPGPHYVPASFGEEGFFVYNHVWVDAVGVKRYRGEIVND